MGWFDESIQSVCRTYPTATGILGTTFFLSTGYCLLKYLYDDAGQKDFIHRAKRIEAENRNLTEQDENGEEDDDMLPFIAIADFKQTNKLRDGVMPGWKTLIELRQLAEQMNYYQEREEEQTKERQKLKVFKTRNDPSDDELREYYLLAREHDRELEEIRKKNYKIMSIALDLSYGKLEAKLDGIESGDAEESRIQAAKVPSGYDQQSASSAK